MKREAPHPEHGDAKVRQPLTDLLTIEQAAALARCNHRVIRKAIHAGELEALFSSRWLLEPEVVRSWMVERARQRVTPGPSVRSRRSRAARVRDDRPGNVASLRAMEPPGG